MKQKKSFQTFRNFSINTKFMNFLYDAFLLSFLSLLVCCGTSFNEFSCSMKSKDSLETDEKGIDSLSKLQTPFPEEDFYRELIKVKIKCSCGKTIKSKKISKVFIAYEETSVKSFLKNAFKLTPKQPERIRCDLCNTVMVNTIKNCLPIWSCDSIKHQGRTYDVCLYCANNLLSPKIPNPNECDIENFIEKTKKLRCTTCQGVTIFPLINNSCSMCIPYLKSMALESKIKLQFLRCDIVYQGCDINKLKNLYKKLDRSVVIEKMNLLFVILSYPDSQDLFCGKSDKINSLVKIKEPDFLLKYIASDDLITKNEGISLNKFYRRVYLNLKLDKEQRQYLCDLIRYIKASKKRYLCSIPRYSYYYNQHQWGQRPPVIVGSCSYLFFVFDKNTVYGIEEYPRSI